MALFGAHKGSWFGLPDFGITERLTPNRTAQGGSNLIGGPNASTGQVRGASDTNLSGLTFTPGTSTLNLNNPQTYNPPASRGGGGSNVAPNFPGQPILLNDLQQQQDVGNQGIDADYENWMAELRGQESGIQSQAGIGEEKANLAAKQQRTSIERERQQAEQGLTEQQNVATTNEQTGLRQARDIFRDVTQRNIAQLSAMGISSSSAAEALAEKLGVETARRIAGITGTANEIRQNIAKEKANINNYLNERLTQVEENLGITIKEIQNNLFQAAEAINRQKNVAASERARKRAELISQTQTAIANITAKAQEFSFNLQQQMAARAQRLQEANNYAINTQGGLNNMVNTLGTLRNFGFNQVPAGITQGIGVENLRGFLGPLAERSTNEGSIFELPAAPNASGDPLDQYIERQIQNAR